MQVEVKGCVVMCISAVPAVCRSSYVADDLCGGEIVSDLEAIDSHLIALNRLLETLLDFTVWATRT
jgi:hypothetical protein